MPLKRIIVSLVAAATLAGTASAGATLKTRVWLVSADPVSVMGSGFAPGESVLVKVTAGKVELRRSKSATATGRFSMRWNGSLAGGCRTITITARGTSGRAALWREVANDCGPPIGRL
jgi:hypothetical protein